MSFFISSVFTQWVLVERRQIVDYLIDNGVFGIVAITGDIHTFFAGTVHNTNDDRGHKAFPEFVGGSATSYGIPEATGLSDAFLKGLVAFNPHVDFFDFRARRYGVVEANATTLTCVSEREGSGLAGVDAGEVPGHPGEPHSAAHHLSVRSSGLARRPVR